MSRRGTRRLRRRSRTCSPMGRSIALGRFPKGNEGKTQGRLPLGNPVCLWQTELFKLNLKSSPSSSGYNRRRRLATRSSGKQQAERTAVRTAPIVCPEESPLVRPQAHTPCPGWSLTRRLRREWWGCRPEGVVLSFEAKESTKESPRHGDYVKKASTAHFAGGARNVARDIVGELFPSFVRAPVLTFFRRQNGRAFFPPLPIAALLHRGWRLANSKECQLGCFDVI